MNPHEVVQVLNSTRVKYWRQNLFFVWTAPLFPPACEQRPFLTRFSLSFLFRSLTGGSDSWSQSRGAAQQNNRLLSPLLFHSLSLILSPQDLARTERQEPRGLWHSYLLLSLSFGLFCLVLSLWHWGLKVNYCLFILDSAAFSLVLRPDSCGRFFLCAYACVRTCPAPALAVMMMYDLLRWHSLFA